MPFVSTAAITNTLSESVTMEPMLQMKLPPLNVSHGKNTGNKSKLKCRPRLDPSHALEPARKKIATIEAQRVMSVFEDTIVKVEFITLLPYIINNLDRFRISLCSKLSDLLQCHGVILNSFEELQRTLDKQINRKDNIMKAQHTSPSIKDGPEGKTKFDRNRDTSPASLSTTSLNSQIESTLRSLTMVALQLSASCKRIIRAFNKNHSVMNTIKQEYPTRALYPQEVVTYMHELRDIVLNKLLTTPEEEKEKMEYLQEISKRERYNAALIEKLEAEQKAAQQDKDEEIKKRNDVIRGLQADLRHIQKFSEDHNKRVIAEAEKQKTADKKTSESRRQKLQNEIVQLQTQLKNLTRAHRESEYDLRKKKFKIEIEVENWIQRYDQEMGERQDEFEKIDAVYTVEKKQLHELEERFSVLEKKYSYIMEERRIARERREAAMRELLRSTKAATTIQAFWRAFKVRKILKTRKKKGGKKKRD